MATTRILDFLRYDRVTGNFHWIESCGRVKSGDVAGCVDDKGYVRIRLKRKLYLAHRLAWIVENGPIPRGMEIDHVNGNKSDNRICNLRLASRNQNEHNKGIQSNNTSGVKGVTWHKRASKWQAQVSVNGRKKYIGFFSRLEDAKDAVEKARLELHGDFSRDAWNTRAK